jgi:F-type H+-transporting ATPase subunit epsilon
MSLKLKIVSPERIEYEGEVASVLVPGSAGRFEVLVNHAPIISSLDKGKVVYTLPDGEKKTLDIIGGFVQVQKNVVSVCVELHEA